MSKLAKIINWALTIGTALALAAQYIAQHAPAK